MCGDLFEEGEDAKRGRYGWFVEEGDHVKTLVLSKGGKSAHALREFLIPVR